MTTLIADGGSTKTDWALLKDAELLIRFTTQGMNPGLMSDETIVSLLKTEVLPILHDTFEKSQIINEFFALADNLDHVVFYGAGCRSEQEERMSRLLMAELGSRNVFVASDLLGAAHALCGEEEGIVCILGTGSGSALYDGKCFVQSTPSLGYVLGDEGSGAVLGRRLLSDVLKSQLPSHLCRAFIDTYKVDAASVIQHVYREATPNRYLAGFTRFLAAHREESSIQALLIDEFRRFFLRNVCTYGRSDLSVNFVGSIAFVFEQELREAASSLGLIVGKILRSPLDALITGK